MFHFFLGEKHPSCPGESWDVSSFKYNLSLFGSLSNNAISGSDTNCLTTAFYKGAFLSFITEQCILQIAFVQIAGQSFKLRSRSSPGGSGPDGTLFSLSVSRACSLPARVLQINTCSPWKGSQVRLPILQRKTPFWKSNDRAAFNFVLHF